MLTRQFKLFVWASLSVPTGRVKSLCYAILSYVQTLKDCFLHLRFESNSAIEQDEASLVHIARRNALLWDSFIASRVGKTNLYQTLHVHVHWTWQHKISIPFTWRKIIPNSANQNGIGRFPDFSFPLAEWKVWLARLSLFRVTTPSCPSSSFPFHSTHNCRAKGLGHARLGLHKIGVDFGVVTLDTLQCHLTLTWEKRGLRDQNKFRYRINSYR